MITFIDYSAAFDTESQLFLHEALADAGVPSKVRRIIQAIFTAATGVVRVRQPNGKMAMSEPFNIERGVLQGDIFSPVSFIAGLGRIFRRHDINNSGVTVGAGENAVCVSKLEYADDAALIDENVEQASARVTSIAKGSLEEAAMVISIRKSKVMHIHKKTRVSATIEAEADVRYRMDIAQAAFASLSHLWTDRRLSRNLKLRLYNLCVCSTLTHSCEAWNLTKVVSRILNGFNSRCLHVITGEEYRVTAVSPAYNLLLFVRQRRLRYLGHLLRLPHDSVVRRTRIAMAGGGNRYPEGSHFMDCHGSELKDLDIGNTCGFNYAVPLDPLGPS